MTGHRNEAGRHKRPANPYRLELLSEAEMIERIERIRLEDAPALCPTCGSTTPEVVAQKACAGPCGRVLPIEAFDRDRKWRYPKCKDCRRPTNIRSGKAFRKRKALKALGVAS